MKRYTDCGTRRTGLYKPHTIKVDLMYISIIYGDKDYYIKDMRKFAIATDKNGNKYELYYSQKGCLAFPVNPDKITGFYPWL